MISDGVVIGVVLGLIFAAVSYYLYSRIGQLERKVSLMENILLDLKVTTEQTLMSVTEPSEQQQHQQQDKNEYVPLSEDVNHEESRDVNVEPVHKVRSSSSNQVTVEREKSSVSVNYEAMTYKEIVQLCKSKGVSGIRNLSKAQIIDMLKRHDSGDSESSNTVSFGEESSEGTNLVELLSAQPTTQGAALDDSEIDSSLVQ